MYDDDGKASRRKLSGDASHATELAGRVFKNSERVKQMYLDVLKNEVKHTQRGSAVFQDDNAPCHRTKSIKEWFARKEADHIEE